MNNQIFFFFYDLAHRSFFLDQVIIFIAHTLPYLMILAVGIFLLFHHEVFRAEKPLKAFFQKWKEIILVFFSGGLAWCVATLIKILVRAPRPFAALSGVTALIDKTDFSFPSGHATFYMALATAVFLSHKKAGLIFGFFTLIIGLARIAAGVHFPVDILTGFVIGIGITYLVNFLYRKIRK